MRALYMTAFETLELDEGPEPDEPQQGEIVLKMAASGLGVTQLQLLEGILDAGQLPRILGHEIVGTVEKLGQGVSGLQPGDLVVVDPLVGCGVCPRCLEGEDSICPRHAYLGMSSDGGYAEYVTVPAQQAFPIAPDTPLEEAVMLCSALPTAVHGVRRAGVQPGDTALVLGVGSIGIMLCQVARAFGATTVVAVDVDARRLSEAEPFVDRAVHTGELSHEDAVRRIRQALPDTAGADVVFESAGVPETLAISLETVRPGGTILALGLIEGAHDIHFGDYVNDFSLRELTLTSTYAYARADFPLAVRLYQAGRVDVRPIPGRIVTLPEVPDMIPIMRREGLKGKRHVVRLR